MEHGVEALELPTEVHPDQGRRMWEEPGFKAHLRRIRGPRDQNRCGKYARSRIHSHLGGSESARAQPSRGPAKVQGPRPDFCKVGISDSAPQHGIWGAKSKRAPGCQPESCPVSDLGYLRSPCGGRRRRRRWSWRLPGAKLRELSSRRKTSPSVLKLS